MIRKADNFLNLTYRCIEFIIKKKDTKAGDYKANEDAEQYEYEQNFYEGKSR